MGHDADARSELKYTRISEVQPPDATFEDQCDLTVRTSQIKHSSRTFFLGVVIGVISAAVFSIVIQPLLEITWSPSLGSNVRKFAPEIPATTTITFERFHDLKPPYHDVGEDYWKEQIPDRDVMIYVPNPEEYSLPLSIPSETGSQGYMLAMHHQMHCMGVISKVFWTLVRNLNASSSEPQSQSAMEQVIQLVSDKHPQHCFQYMARSIACSADLTLEHARVNSKGERVDFDGWNIPHRQCRDPEKVREWVEGNHRAERMRLGKIKVDLGEER